MWTVVNIIFILNLKTVIYYVLSSRGVEWNKHICQQLEGDRKITKSCLPEIVFSQHEFHYLIILEEKTLSNWEALYQYI